MPKRKTRNNLRKSQHSNYLLALSIIIAAVLIATSRGTSSEVKAVERKDQIIVGQFDTVKVPVPTMPIKAGARLRSASFQLIRYPKHQLSSDALVDLTPYLDAVAIAALPANLPLFKSNLSLNSSLSNPVIDKIPAGMRAITVRVDATSAVEGWAAAGAVVDVLLVTKARSSVVAEMVKILSAERNTSTTASTSPEIPSTVTLLVSQEQALAINTATNNGKIAFALRSLSDDDSWGPQVFESTSLQRRSSNLESNVGGYIRVGETSAFTLVDGKWVESKTKPAGFFPAEK